jgi:hypothetical protein
LQELRQYMQNDEDVLPQQTVVQATTSTDIGIEKPPPPRTRAGVNSWRSRTGGSFEKETILLKIEKKENYRKTISSVVIPAVSSFPRQKQLFFLIFLAHKCFQRYNVSLNSRRKIIKM